MLSLVFPISVKYMICSAIGVVFIYMTLPVIKVSLFISSTKSTKEGINRVHQRCAVDEYEHTAQHRNITVNASNSIPVLIQFQAFAFVETGLFFWLVGTGTHFQSVEIFLWFLIINRSTSSTFRWFLLFSYCLFVSSFGRHGLRSLSKSTFSYNKLTCIISIYR